MRMDFIEPITPVCEVALYQPQILHTRPYIGLMAHTRRAVGKSSFELLQGNLFAALAISLFPRLSLSPLHHFPPPQQHMLRDGRAGKPYPTNLTHINFGRFMI